MKNPPFCPNPKCKYHLPEAVASMSANWFWKTGVRTVKSSLIPIQRYRCKECGKQFSETTFTKGYFEKFHINREELMECILMGMSIRGISRFFNCSPNTVIRKIKKLS